MKHLHTLTHTAITWRLEIITFIIGFGLMAYELVASRILSPSLGSSTYVWTSVIGVIIGALSAGYAVGGTLADRRARSSDIALLLLLSAFSMTMTLINAQSVLDYLMSVASDPRLQGFFASLLLFAPTSFILGMISPYLARLRNVALDTTGRAVARLSALNAIGGIVGTFSVGYVFFGFIGTRQTLVIIVGLLLLTSWALDVRVMTRLRVIGTLLTFAVLTLFLALPSTPKGTKDIDTATAHYQVVDTAYKNQPMRALLMGPGGVQSGVFIKDPSALAFPYTKQVAEVVARLSQPRKILILGGGAFTLPQYLADKYSQSSIDVVEIDPELPSIAKRYFSYKEPSNVTVIAEDARAYLNRENTKLYDIIVVDVYNSLSVPFSVTTVEYVKALKRVLNSDGSVIVNLIDTPKVGCTSVMGSLHATYQHVFPYYKALAQLDPTLRKTQNVVTLYSARKLSEITEDPRTQRAMPKGEILTDDFSPIERLENDCRF